jgi:hypothetical protein
MDSWNSASRCRVETRSFFALKPSRPRSQDPPKHLRPDSQRPIADALPRRVAARDSPPEQCRVPTPYRQYAALRFCTENRRLDFRHRRRPQGATGQTRIARSCGGRRLRLRRPYCASPPPQRHACLRGAKMLANSPGRRPEPQTRAARVYPCGQASTRGRAVRPSRKPPPTLHRRCRQPLAKGTTAAWHQRRLQGAAEQRLSRQIRHALDNQNIASTL